MTKSAPASNQFDYIFAGAGCAALSLLMRLLQQPVTEHARILLVDKEPASMLNKTWCFWEKEAGFFQSVVHHQYDQLWYHGNGCSQLSSIAPYAYKMIRGEDFYRHCMEVISHHPNVQFLQGDIEGMHGDGDQASVIISGETYTTPYIFNSVVTVRPVLAKHEYLLLQHFKGWFIKTEEAVFDPAAATLMDFRIPQDKGTAFVYVMPLSEREALVEYTLFTEQLLTDEQYEEGLRSYLSDYIKTAYTIQARETGAIPMTNYRFPESEGRIIHIGTAGGQTKPSSGYTFQFIQQQSDQLAAQLARGERPSPTSYQRTRFHFYDAVLLDVLANKRLPGEVIFTKLFRKNRLPLVLQFLGNQSSLPGEIRLISVLPKIPFLKAALRQLFH